MHIALRPFVPLALLAVWTLTASATNDTPAWHYCSKRQTPVQISKFNFLPAAPAPGDLVAFNITGDAGKEIKSGTVGISVELGKLPLYSTSGNLCASTHCPIPKGHFAISFEQTLPSLTPPGKYTVKLQIGEKQNSLEGPALLCIEVDFQVKTHKQAAKDQEKAKEAKHKAEKEKRAKDAKHKAEKAKKAQEAKEAKHKAEEEKAQKAKDAAKVTKKLHKP